MKRTSVNFWVDVLAFVDFVFLATTGLLVRYVLPPGSGHFGSVGEGRQAEGKAVSTVWGMTRHEWGDVHFYLALALLGLMAVHLFLHWRWIIHVVRGTPSNRSGFRLAIGAIGLIGVIFLSLLPL
ncbi:MAG: DUF4405 domain-containing protein, partial [Pirellulales bacterium]|nr:DUF4405 domain-containing protein [Pirellulales bacterium]